MQIRFINNNYYWTQHMIKRKLIFFSSKNNGYAMLYTINDGLIFPFIFYDLSQKWYE